MTIFPRALGYRVDEARHASNMPLRADRERGYPPSPLFPSGGSSPTGILHATAEIRTRRSALLAGARIKSASMITELLLIVHANEKAASPAQALLFHCIHIEKAAPTPVPLALLAQRLW
ncbi:hypothetical protein E8F20_11140 [Pseudomonas sp. BN415]|uniref:hypothetical protein n=1 Tax=Pseudomonas sp. BN415 TaxID=2567889 RepID=UPI0024578C76|nr:hypothetical protein [Pseudomonas sp. BN415]MDH4582423.1 hypothetical protein [Pseudomonas sp. BN415]